MRFSSFRYVYTVKQKTLAGDEFGGLINLQLPKFSPSKNPVLILQILWRAEFAKVLYSK